MMPTEMKKIVIIGSPGAGKSTFAQALGEILNIEVLHLDRYFWQTGWKEHPREKRIQIQQELVEGKEQWIMEGSYISSADSRLQAADTIIFLDIPPLLCLWRVIKRHIFTSRRVLRFDLPNGCTDKFSLRNVLKVLLFPLRDRHQLIEKIAQICVGKHILSYRSTKDLKHFLSQPFQEQTVVDELKLRLDGVSLTQHTTLRRFSLWLNDPSHAGA